MMKVLDYSEVNGAQDRDDTILIVKIVPHPSNISQPREAVVYQQTENDFGANNIVISQLSMTPDALAPGEGQKVRGTILV